VSELNIIEAEKQVGYKNLEVTANGTFIFSKFSDIYKMEKLLSNMQIIKSHFEMDMIKFKSWNGNILEFECNEMGRWERHKIMELDVTNWRIKLKGNASKNACKP
jgi:hypothetical protein